MVGWVYGVEVVFMVVRWLYGGEDAKRYLWRWWVGGGGKIGGVMYNPNPLMTGWLSLSTPTTLTLSFIINFNIDIILL